jgi:FkbM family methyltransferase
MIQKELHVFGKTFRLSLRNDGDVAVADEVLVNRNYRFCEEVIKKATGCVIDIGGHLGFFSLMASALNAKVPIYCYEPYSGNYAIMKKNFKDNHIQNVFPKQVAVSNQVGEAQLKLSKEDLNHSLIMAIEPTGQNEKVQTTTLEHIFEKNRIERCDLLKLDCEGSEYDILGTVSKPLFSRIGHIFLEYHDWNRAQGRAKSQDLQNYLKSVGYKIQRFPNARMPELGYLWATKN